MNGTEPYTDQAFPNSDLMKDSIITSEWGVVGITTWQIATKKDRVWKHVCTSEWENPQTEVQVVVPIPVVVS